MDDADIGAVIAIYAYITDTDTGIDVKVDARCKFGYCRVIPKLCGRQFLE